MLCSQASLSLCGSPGSPVWELGTEEHGGVSGFKGTVHSQGGAPNQPPPLSSSVLVPALPSPHRSSWASRFEFLNVPKRTVFSYLLFLAD